MSYEDIYSSEFSVTPAMEMPLVSVCVVTYNQENYIKKCIQSILDQESKISLEIIISDDCSTDKTLNIVMELGEKHPTIIKIIDNKNNIGAFENYKKVHLMARGKYVCHIDGDDWIRPGKIKKQIDFLDANQSVILVAHRMAIWLADKICGYTKSAAKTISVEMLLRSHPIFLNSSIMYRRDKLQDVFAEENKFIDFYVYAKAINRGDIGYIDEVLGDYRSNIGISSKNNFMEYVNDAINVISSKHGECAAVKRCRSRHYLSYAHSDLICRDFESMRLNINNAILSDDEWLIPRGFKILSSYPLFLMSFAKVRRYIINLVKLFY